MILNLLLSLKIKPMAIAGECFYALYVLLIGELLRMKMPGFNSVTIKNGGKMSNAIFDLLYIIDSSVTIILKVGAISIILSYFVRD